MGFDEDEILEMENEELRNNLMELEAENKELKTKMLILEADIYTLKSKCMIHESNMVLNSEKGSNSPDYTLLLKQAVSLLQNIAVSKQEEIQQWEYLEIDPRYSGELRISSSGHVIIDPYKHKPMTINDWNKLGNFGWEVTGAVSESNGYTYSILLKRKKILDSQSKN